jgi:protein gp37
MGVKKYANEFEVTLHEKVLEIPLSWKTPHVIFVNSMSDLFHENIPEDFIQKVFSVMKKAHWHQFQVLTKRSERLAEITPRIDWPQNVWMGVSVENADYAFRIDHLRQTEAHIKFLSLEPLLGPLSNLNLDHIDWVIVGGESGPGARPIQKDWVTEIRDQCIVASVPFFFKQWGGIQKKRAGRELDGMIWDEMPIVELAAA